MMSQLFPVYRFVWENAGGHSFRPDGSLRNDYQSEIWFQEDSYMLIAKTSIASGLSLNFRSFNHESINTKLLEFPTIMRNCFLSESLFRNILGSLMQLSDIFKFWFSMKRQRAKMVQPELASHSLTDDQQCVRNSTGNLGDIEARSHFIVVPDRWLDCTDVSSHWNHCSLKLPLRILKEYQPHCGFW
jgi:hypothetical protein